MVANKVAKMVANTGGQRQYLDGCHRAEIITVSAKAAIVFNASVCLSLSTNQKN